MSAVDPNLAEIRRLQRKLDESEQTITALRAQVCDLLRAQVCDLQAALARARNR